MVKTNSNINLNFQFEGIGTFEDVNNEVIRLNEMLEGMDLPFIVSKRIYAISIELLYNVVYHGMILSEHVPKLEFYVQGNDNNITLTCSNYIAHVEVAKLRNVIAGLNAKEFDELRKMKGNQIKNGGISERGGAGLGLIDIRMKSENPIEANLKLINSKVDWLTIEATINMV